MWNGESSGCESWWSSPQKKKEAIELEEKQKAEKVGEKTLLQRKHETTVKIQIKKTQLTIVRPQPIVVPLVPAYSQQQAMQPPRLTIVRQQPNIAPAAAESSTITAAAPVCTSKNISIGYGVDYVTARDASSKARHIAPISKGRGKELVTVEIPWRPKPGERAFGDYKCACGVSWSSSSSWTDKTQACKKCGNNVLPYKQRPRTYDRACPIY